MNTTDDSIPDEEWDRFLQDISTGTGADSAPREPSARARIVKQRLQSMPATEGRQVPRRPAVARRRRTKYAVVLIIAVAVLALLGTGTLTGRFGGVGPASPLAEETERPTGPEDGAAGRGTIAEPFRGSPAARWADGADGIHVPTARAVGWMDEKQVADALEATKEFLVASNLSDAVLRGDPPAEAIRLLNPQQEDVQDYLASTFAAPTPESDPTSLFSRFDADEVELVGDIVKVRGRLDYREGDLGALEVATDVTYVYPVKKPQSADDEVVRVIVRREIVASWDDPAKVRITPGTFTLLSYVSDVTNGRCGPFTGYLAPQFDTHQDTQPGPAVDPYDRSRTIDESIQGQDADEGCGRASRA